MDYTLDKTDMSTVLKVHSGGKTTKIEFTGKNHKEDAYEFLARHLMVQMGQIGI
jgi:hypothetical protein